jgi:hypothetical protein
VAATALRMSRRGAFWRLSVRRSPSRCTWTAASDVAGISNDEGRGAGVPRMALARNSSFAIRYSTLLRDLPCLVPALPG